MDAFYRLLQTNLADTREVAGESADQLESRLVDARALLAQGREFVRECEAAVERLEHAVRAVRRVAGEDLSAVRLRGRALGRLAITVLRESGREQPIHYTEWFRLLEDGGYVIGAKDPMATFLTSITRDERIERVGHRTGMYQLKEST